MIMPFTLHKKRKKYKYNDYDQVKKWSIEKINKNINNINPKIICDLALEGMKEYVHPDTGIVYTAYDPNSSQKIINENNRK